MANVSITKQLSVLDQLEVMHERIAGRAYELFQSRDGVWGDPFGDWLTAERELVWKPDVELREHDDALTVMAALPGVEPNEIMVDITPQEVLIRAATEHTHAEDQGKIHHCEFRAGEIFRSVPLPKAIDTTKAKAEYRNGLLRITAPVVLETRPKARNVAAA